MDKIIAEIDKVRSKCKKSKDGDMGSNIYDLKGNLLFSQVDYLFSIVIKMEERYNPII